RDLADDRPAGPTQLNAGRLAGGDVHAAAMALPPSLAGARVLDQEIASDRDLAGHDALQDEPAGGIGRGLAAPPGQGGRRITLPRAVIQDDLLTGRQAASDPQRPLDPAPGSDGQVGRRARALVADIPLGEAPAVEREDRVGRLLRPEGVAAIAPRLDDLVGDLG